MIKYLGLLRHAQAQQESIGVCDHARTLTPQGIEEAAQLGVWLAKQSDRYDAVLCSTAERTRQTLASLNSLGAHLPDATYSADLYLASSEHILEELKGLGDTVERVLVIGHNPGLHETAINLINNITPQYEKLYKGFPPCSLAEIKLPVASWRDLTHSIGEMTGLRLPSQLKLSQGLHR